MGVSLSASNMTLYSGRRVDPWNLAVGDIDIVSIAHSLSLLCRFGGHSTEFYSVAQHSVRVAQRVPKEYRLEGVLHDGTEAFVQDLIRPVKRRLVPYKDLEKKIWQQFSFKFGLGETLSYPVVAADDEVLLSEIRQFLNNPGRDLELAEPYWKDVEEVDPVHRVWSPAEAEAMFMMTYTDAVAQRVKFLQNGVVQCGRCSNSECDPSCVFYESMKQTKAATN